MRRLAERIEYSVTAIYAHFADKEALLRGLCEREFSGLHEAMFQVDFGGDALESLRQLGLAYCHFALEHPQAYRLMFLLEGMPSRGDNKPELDPYDVCVATVTNARAAGALRPELDDDELVAQTLWASLHGVLALQLVKHDKGIPWRSIEARIEGVLDLLINGLRRSDDKAPTKKGKR
jgi:AcrR family transcriptional regulator